jgi:hypothetical protein
MCDLPQGTRLLYRPQQEAEVKSYPVLCCDNVYMLPGVPRFCREQLAFVAQLLTAKQGTREGYARQVRCLVSVVNC